MVLAEARLKVRELEVKVMKLIHEFEDNSGCIITKASMEYYDDTRFFKTIVMLGIHRSKKPGEE